MKTNNETANTVQPSAELEQIAKDAAMKTREGFVYDHEKVILTALTTATAKLREENERLKEKLDTIESCARAVRNSSDAVAAIQFIKGTANYEND